MPIWNIFQNGTCFGTARNTYRHLASNGSKFLQGKQKMNKLITTCDLFTATWGSWGSYGSCSKSCGSGTKTKSRSCNGLGSCSGTSSQSESCNNGVCGKMMISVYIVMISILWKAHTPHFVHSKTPNVNVLITTTHKNRENNGNTVFKDQNWKLVFACTQRSTLKVWARFFFSIPQIEVWLLI